MNIDRLTELQNYLSVPGPLPNNYQFNMNVFMRHEGTKADHWCGTECCLAGLTVLLFSEPRPQAHISTASQASQLLNLTPTEASALFYPYRFPEPRWEDITPAQAAQAIQKLIAGSLSPWA